MENNQRLVQTGIVIVIAVVFFYTLFNFLSDSRTDNVTNVVNITDVVNAPSFENVIVRLVNPGIGATSRSSNNGELVQQTIFQEGTGDRQAKDGDRVSVSYIGQFEDGEVFDRSPEDQAFTFTLGAGQVIPGFEEIVRGMKISEIRVGRLDPSVAYGAAGSPPAIPPNTPLIFGIQLISIE